MKHIIEEYLDTILEGAGAVAFVVIFSAIFLSGIGAQLISGIVSGFC